MSTETRDSQCEHQSNSVQLILPRFKAITQVDLTGKLMDAWCIKGKFCENNKVGKPSCFSHLAKIEVIEDETKISSATTGNLITRSLPPWFTVRDLFHHSSNTILQVMSYSWSRWTNPEECTKKNLSKKRLLPYIFQSSVTYVCAVFLFWKLVHRNRDRDISISALGCVLEGKKGRMTVAQYWEMERKASKCLNNYLSSWVVT